MILSHEHRYVFVEAPRTGSTAIANELCARYGGTPILYRHATYRMFLRQASEDERTYFAFSGIRNPLDSFVSRFFKLKTDMTMAESNPEEWRSGHGSVLSRRQVSWIRENEADFEAYFLRYSRFPYLECWSYDDFSSLAHDRMDFLIRFERIQEDFTEALRRIGLELERPLPQRNATAERSSQFLDYYTPRTRERALFTFGPYMERWGYDFPVEWGLPGAPWTSRLLFQVLAPFRRLWWEYFKHWVRPLRGWIRRLR